MSETEDHLKQVDALHAKIARSLSEHRQSFSHNDEQFWSFCSCNENEPHVMEDGPDMPDPVEKRAFWATGVQIFAEHLAACAVDEVEESDWVSPEEAKAREAAARREALLEELAAAADEWDQLEQRGHDPLPCADIAGNLRARIRVLRAQTEDHA